MTSPQVETATAADEAVVIDTLMLAFAGDPMARWSWAAPATYLAAFPRFVRAFGGKAFELGSAHLIGDSAAALWLPPDMHADDEAMGALMHDTIPESVQAEGLQVMQQMQSFHPAEPHWYLPLIGVDPARQGKGLGGALLDHAIDRFDRDGAPAYLESSNLRNVPLYERHGFQALGSIQVGSSPTMIPMLRKPKRRR